MIRWVLLITALIGGGGFVIELGLLIASPPPPVGDIPRTGWTIAWLCWLLFVTLSFFAIELPALLNDHGGDTLTEHIEYVAGQSPVWTGTIAVSIASFTLWFLSHLFGRDSRVWKYLRVDPNPQPEVEVETLPEENPIGSPTPQDG